jgi:hypothetical protein
MRGVAPSAALPQFWLWSLMLPSAYDFSKLLAGSWRLAPAGRRFCPTRGRFHSKPQYAPLILSLPRASTLALVASVRSVEAGEGQMILLRVSRCPAPHQCCTACEDSSRTAFSPL